MHALIPNVRSKVQSERIIGEWALLQSVKISEIWVDGVKKYQGGIPTLYIDQFGEATSTYT